jgi:chemotaxis signal transduction protein
MVIMAGIAEVPDTPEYVRGVINLRGRVVPLLDL